MPEEKNKSKLRRTKGSVVRPSTEVALAKLGKDIEFARRVRGISADTFAKSVGISRSTLHRLESGNGAGVSLNTLAISDIHGNELKILEVLDAAQLFNIDTDEAREALRVMAEIIRDRWRPLASELGMKAKDIKVLKAAFESPQVKEALSL